MSSMITIDIFQIFVGTIPETSDTQVRATQKKCTLFILFSVLLTGHQLNTEE